MFKKSVSQFSSAIVSKHILDHDSIYCCIFPQALESCLDTCAVLMSSIFVSKINQPVFVRYCVQTHFGSRKHILLYISLSLGKLSRYMRCNNVIDFCFKAQSTAFRRLLFPNTFWVTKTYIVIYFPQALESCLDTCDVSRSSILV